MIVPTVGGPPPVIGSIRYNPTSMFVEMWDGQNWVSVSNQTVELQEEDLVLSVGSVLGKVYNCVEPIRKPWAKMFDWCMDTMGNCGNQAEQDVFEPNARWYVRDGKFWFSDPEDQLLFVIRWT